MAIQIINNGTVNNDKNADKTRAAFGKTNANFAELDARVRAIEGFSLPRGQYTSPGNPPFPDFTYTEKDGSRVQLLSTLSFSDQSNGFPNSLAGNFLVHALNAETVAVVGVTGTSFVVTVVKIYEDGQLAFHKNSGPIPVGMTGSVTVTFSYPISETAFGVHFYSGGNGRNFRIETATEQISVSSVSAAWVSGTRSRTSKGFLSQSGLTATTVGTFGAAVGAYRLTTAPGVDENAFSMLCSYKISNMHTPAHDYLGNGRFIAAHLGSRRGQGNFFTVSVFDADDDSARLKGNIVVSSPELIASISIFALSPTLAIASWSSGGVQRACAVSVDSDGNPAFLGEIQVSGVFGNVLYAATTLNEKTLLAGIWPTDTLPGQLVKLRVDTDIGQIVEEQSFQISATTKSRFADFIRLTDDKFVVVSTPTAAPFGITLELVELTE
ncbi:hypothetical protein [Pseudochrobactrum asaccharolyticum]|uniref:hypothetical protein n=1 Tax=Pseudochrobactrum asaccharolyticum TaxID=354351 RepID=UPI0040430BA2